MATQLKKKDRCFHTGGGSIRLYDVKAKTHLGNFRNFVQVAEHLEKCRRKGTFYAASGPKRRPTIREVTYDGVFVEVENYGFV